MSPAVQPGFFEEHAWVLGEAEDWSGLSDAARRLRETRIAAMLFKRRWRLLIHWRRQSLARSRRDRADVAPPMVRRRATVDGEITVLTDLPRRLPVLREEIAILRAFLAREINTILFDEAP